MRLKRLLATVACIVLGMSILAGCAKEEPAVNPVVDETSVSETTEVSEEASVESESITPETTEISEEAESTESEKTDAIDPDDIKLRNIYTEAYAKVVVLPAEPDMEFDENVELELEQLTWIQMGDLSTNMGKLTTEDVLSVGYEDVLGNAASIDEDMGTINAFAEGYDFAAFCDGNIVNRIILLDTDREDADLPEISTKFTEFGIEAGTAAETLKVLGEPDLAAQIDEEMYYYWQVETEAGGCCFCAQVEDNSIVVIEIMIF